VSTPTQEWRTERRRVKVNGLQRVVSFVLTGYGSAARYITDDSGAPKRHTLGEARAVVAALHEHHPTNSPGRLTVKRHDDAPQQAQIESDHRHLAGHWDDIYVDFSGFFGSYGPHLFAAAPEVLEALERARSLLVIAEGQFPPAFNARVRAAIAQAGLAIARAKGGTS
jgi:hypothetical protein